MLCTWVTEIYLNKLNQLKNSHLDDQHEMLQEEFSQFLADNLVCSSFCYILLFPFMSVKIFIACHKEYLDRTTTINLIQSHGRGDELLCYCILMEDWERVIEYHLQHSSWDRAIAVLSKLSSSEIYYKVNSSLFFIFFGHINIYPIKSIRQI